MANGAGKFVGGFLIGSAVGTVLGLLFAPKTGKETRRLLRKSADAIPEIAEEISSNVQYQADRFSEQAGKTIDSTMERMQEAIAVGKDASQRLRQELNAMKVASISEEDDSL